MKYLLDTHILLWLAARASDGRLSGEARSLIANPENTSFFSVVSIWEVAIKQRLGKPDFQVDPGILRRGLLDNGYPELVVTGEHAVAVGGLPDIHKDPFDRLLVAQVAVEGITLLTADAVLARYPASVRLV